LDAISVAKKISVKMLLTVLIKKYRTELKTKEGEEEILLE
jgi:hypothetical protein